MIVGCGGISRKHLAAIKCNIDSYRLIAACDVDISRANQLAKEYNQFAPAEKVRCFDDYLQCLEESKVDVVVVSSSSSSHAAIAIRALEAGAHLIIEKPVALSTEDLNKVQKAAISRSARVTVCYVTRFLPHFRALHYSLERKRFGRILHAQLSVNWNRGDKYYLDADWRGTWDHDGGMIMNQCTHGLDILQMAMPSLPKKISGVFRRFQRPIESEDYAAAMIEFKDGSVATFNASVNVYPQNFEQSFAVFGERGTVAFGGNHLEKVTAWRFADAESFGDFESKATCGQFSYLIANNKTGHDALYCDFARALREDREPFINLKSARVSVDIALHIYQSIYEGQSVNWPPNFSTSFMKRMN